MNCECNNKSNRVKPGIKHVYGNVLRMAIPLTLRTLVKDGDEMVVTDTDFIPSSDHPVRVVFSKGKTNYPIIATMDGNVAIVEDKGKIPVGTYDISVECYDDLGNPYRFKQNAVLYVTDTTAEAGIDEEIEYEAQTWYLNAAVFLATTEIGEIGDAIDAKLDDVFGNVAYDANAKEIRFYNKDNSRVLATIDSRPFIVDGTVADVYIDVSRQVLVVVLNDDAGGTRFSVPLYLVFNSYYKKDEVDSLVSRMEKGLRFDFSQELPLVVHVTKNGSSYSSPVDFGAIANAIREDGRIVVACVNNDIFYQLLVADRAEIAFSRVVALDGYQELLIVDPHNVWSMEDVDLGTGGGGGGYEPPAGGIPKTDLASAVQESLDKADTALQQSDLDGYATTDDVDDAVAALVSSAPQTLDTLKELADALGDDPNFATTMATQLGNKVDKETGKSLMTDAERTKLQGIAAGAEVNVQADWNQTTTTADDYIKNKPTIPTKTSDLTNDSGFIDKAMYYGESTTAAATMPKVCTVETFPTYTNNGVTHAKEGTIIAVKFTNSDTNTTAAPELNVNSIGAKAIMYNSAIVTSTAKNTTVAGYAKQIAYYRYDPELDEGNGAWEFLGKSVDSNSTYSNASLGQGYGTQTNSAAATAITASISSYALSAGGIVTIKFTYDVPANATLNISSKGAKAIYNQGAAITAGVIKAGDTATFVYSTYYHLIAVDSWQDKQDAISDLATIRSGAAAGATALQSYTETDPTVPSWAKASTKPSYTASEISGLATVATSGSYNDLSNKPTIPAAQVNSDWDASSGVAQILNKPSFKTINGQSLVGNGNITVVGEKGDKGDTGNVTVTDGVAQITIVNDLTTGGTGDALSAEMGKVLNDKVEDLEPHTTSSEADFDIRDENGNVLVSCSEGHIKTSEFDSRNVYNKQEVDHLVGGDASNPHLHILVLGNSYSADSWSYLPFIIKEYGIDITLGIYLKSAGCLYYVDSNYSTVQENFHGELYLIDTSEETSWNQTPVIAMASPHSSVRYPYDNALGWNWDMIIMQEASTQSVTEGGIGYNATTKVYNHAAGAINKVRQDMADISAHFLLGWNINHTRLADGGVYDKPQTVIDCVKATCEEYQIDFVFPYGTAIFDARRNAGFDALGATGHMLQDNVHLQEGLPCYIAALANVECLFRNFFPAYSAIGDTTVPDSSWINGKVIGRNGDPVGVTESNLKLARQIAVIANKNPFLIKNYI